MSNVIMVMGPPASGKSSLSDSFITDSTVYLNRDKEGGKVISLVPKMVAAIKEGRDVVVDNLFATAEERKPFIEEAKKNGATIEVKFMNTSIEDAQINALNRMYDREGRIFFTAQDIKDGNIKSTNIFPVAVLFKYRKSLQKPKKDEGFDKVEVVKFKRRPYQYVNKAVLFDYDGTLRESTGEQPYPINPEDVEVNPNARKVLLDYAKQGYQFIGVSNQSGIAKGVLTDAQAKACFNKTHEDLGILFPYYYCPHKVPPVSCYCRKPQSGLGVQIIREFKLNPEEVIVVGDQTTDETFAKRLGFKFEFAKDFFA